MSTLRTDGVTKDEVRQIIDEIKDPCSVAAAVSMGLDEMGLVKSIEISPDGQVDVVLRLTSPFCEMVAYMRSEVLTKVGALPGVTAVNVSHDRGLDWEPEMIAPGAEARRRQRLAVIANLPMATSGTRQSSNGYR